jgi:hypothetical protein
MQKAEIPRALRSWFVVHFVVDMLFAIPLMLAPEVFLGMLGWQQVDTFTARLVAAALFGIGIESWLGRNAGREAFIGMLNLKIIWSIAAVVGIGLSLIEGKQGRPLAAWAVLVVFVAFNALWVYWRWRLQRQA